MLKKKFGPKREEIRRSCTKLHNEELHNLNSSPNEIRSFKSRRMKWVLMGRREINVHRLLVGGLERKGRIGRSRRRRKYNI